MDDFAILFSRNHLLSLLVVVEKLLIVREQRDNNRLRLAVKFVQIKLYKCDRKIQKRNVKGQVMIEVCMKPSTQK